MIIANPSLSLSFSPKPLPFFHGGNRSRGVARPVAASAGGLESLQPVLSATSVLAAIVVVHESGHFLAATLRGIRVSKFSLGFGPVLARFVSPSSGVEFSLRALPLGGFVAFPDESDPDLQFPPDDPDLLRNRPLPDRLLVVSAGIAANLLFAYSLLFVQVVSVGFPVQSPLPGVLVPDVRPNSVAAQAGLLPGDVILSSPSVYDLVDLIKLNPAKQLNLTVSRKTASDKLQLAIVPDTSPDGTGRIGVQLSPNYTISKLRASNLAEATILAGKEFGALAFTVFDGLRQTFLNFSQSAGKVSGPVAIIAVGAEVARSGSDGLFQFAAVININLAAINLLPLPALDGGSLALLLVEAARGGRRIPREVEQRIMSSGVLLVLMLGLFLIVRDTLNLDFIKEML